MGSVGLAIAVHARIAIQEVHADIIDMDIDFLTRCSLRSSISVSSLISSVVRVKKKNASSILLQR